jgi:hypothetical protein
MDQFKNKFETEGQPVATIYGAPEKVAIEDIDPRHWLESDDGAVTGFVNTRAGRLKIAALTEAETDQVRRGSEKPINPGNPKSGKRIDLKKLRTLTVCVSLNKAHPGSNIMPDELEKKLSGEITMIVNEISKLSGYSEEEEENLNNFLQTS